MFGFIDENVWVAISFVLFIALVWKRAGSALAAMLDRRAEEIKKNLDEARALRDEAAEELRKYQRRNREAAGEVDRITKDAIAAADQIREAAEKSADAAIARKQQQAEAKIRAMEAEVTAEIKSRAAELAVAAAGELIKGKLDKKSASRLVKDDIETIRKIG